jgi:hypothetical protein
MIKYSLKDIENIKAQGSFKNLKLNEVSKRNIIYIYQNINNTTTIPKLELDPPMKKTVIVKKTTPIDIIKGDLNKLTDKTFDKIKQSIITVIEDFWDEDEKLDFIKQLVVMIWFVASNNSFYSYLYAKLFYELSINYEIINKYFYDNEEYVKYCESFKTMVSINDIIETELEFKINKENDKRKAITKFIMNVCVLNVGLLNVIMTFIINVLSDEILMDEVYEHLFILFDKRLVNRINKYKINDVIMKEYLQLLIVKEDGNKKNKFKLMDVLNNF